MSNYHISTKRITPVTIPTNTAATIVDSLKIAGDGALCGIFTLLIGKSAGRASSVVVEHGPGLGIWSPVGFTAASIPASSDVSVSAVNLTTGVLTSTAHGLVEDQAVVLNTSGSLPSGLSTSNIYFVKVVDANNFQLSASLGANPLPSLGAAGSGTVEVTPIQEVSIKYNEQNNSGVLPLHVNCRISLAAAAGEVQIVQALHTQGA